jgi:hypothetical protein
LLGVLGNLDRSRLAGLRLVQVLVSLRRFDINLLAYVLVLLLFVLFFLLLFSQQRYLYFKVIRLLFALFIDSFSLVLQVLLSDHLECVGLCEDEVGAA